MADDVRGKQQQHAAEVAAHEARARATFEAFKKALDAIAPELAQACRELNITPGRDRIGLTKVHHFGYGNGDCSFAVRPNGTWVFTKYGKKVSEESVARIWGKQSFVDPEQLRAELKRQVELKYGFDQQLIKDRQARKRK